MAKKNKNSFVAYIGTTKLAFMKVRTAPSGEVEVAALAARLANGFSDGVVKDIAVASETLSGAMKDVMGSDEESTMPCRVVVSNHYLKSYTFQSSVYFQDRPHALSMKDVRSAIAQTRSVATIPLQEIIVQAVPQSFMVNDLEGIQNPLGLEAGRLGVTLRLLTLDFSVHSNLLKVFERCELEVVDIVPSILASAETALKKTEKQEGVILINVGGTATHFACYKNSVLVDVSSIPMGADYMTHEISKKLNIDYLDAQKVKEKFGSAITKMEFRDELIPIQDTNGHKNYHIQRGEFEAHMAVALDVFFDKLKDEVKSLQLRYAPLTQLVLTGGGVKLDNFLEVVKDRIHPIARIGCPEEVKGPETIVKNPGFSAILGGARFTSQITNPEKLLATPRNIFMRTSETIRDWIFEYF
jgi:cell division protein FtsA